MQLLPQTGQFDFQCRKSLSQLVMQLTGNALPFFFPGIDHIAGKAT